MAGVLHSALTGGESSKRLTVALRKAVARGEVRLEVSAVEQRRQQRLRRWVLGRARTPGLAASLARWVEWGAHSKRMRGRWGLSLRRLVAWTAWSGLLARPNSRLGLYGPRS